MIGNKSEMDKIIEGTFSEYGYPEDFLAEYDPAVICRDAEALRVTEKDMVCQPKVVMFKA